MWPAHEVTGSLEKAACGCARPIPRADSLDWFWWFLWLFRKWCKQITVLSQASVKGIKLSQLTSIHHTASCWFSSLSYPRNLIPTFIFLAYFPLPIYQMVLQQSSSLLLFSEHKLSMCNHKSYFFTYLRVKTLSNYEYLFPVLGFGLPWSLPQDEMAFSFTFSC